MNLKTIQSAISQFKTDLSRQRFAELDWLYAKQYGLQQDKAFQTMPIGEWLERLFTSDKTNRFWKREDIRSSDLMLSFATFDEDMTKTSFQALFAEERDLEGRIDRFKYYMEELLARKKFNAEFHESWHHQDNAIISYYLMMRYPTKYTYYTYDEHKGLVRCLNAKPLDQGEDPARYQKMIRTISNFVMKDDALLEAHRARFRHPIVEDSRLLVYEFVRYVTK